MKLRTLLLALACVCVALVQAASPLSLIPLPASARNDSVAACQKGINKKSAGGTGRLTPPACAIFVGTFYKLACDEFLPIVP